MATPDDITSDLTLEIGDNLPPDVFLSVVRHFVSYVEKVGRVVAPDGGADDWLLSVKEGSNLIALDPGARAKIVPVRALYRALEKQLSTIAGGNIDAADVPGSAIDHLRALTQVKVKNKLVTPLRVWLEKRPTSLGGAVAQAIEDDFRSNYFEHGSVEGTLDAIQDRKGLQIRVRDPQFRQTVRCVVPEHLLDEVFSNFRKRVEVYGVVHYRKNGAPISISAERMVLLPSDDDLPSISDVRGILRDATWLN